MVGAVVQRATALDGCPIRGPPAGGAVGSLSSAGRAARPDARHFFAVKTYVANSENRERNWLVVDATGQTLGRLATQIADALRGKRKPEYTPHVDTGDFIIVVNASKLRVTGRKAEQKMYYRHTTYPGGIRETNFAKMQARFPRRVLEIAVKGMLPKGPLGYAMLKKLKVYGDDKHPHSAQQPKALEI